MKDKIILIQTTYPNHDAAQALSDILLEKKLSPCIQFTPITSRYIWEGNIENNSEVLLLIKCFEKHYNEIESIITQHHSYDIPEIISMDIQNAADPYYHWFDKHSKQ